MGQVTGYDADYLDQIVGQTVSSGLVVGDDLILTRNDGETIDAGNVRGPQGIQGLTGAAGNPIDLITPAKNMGPIIMAHRGGATIYPENNMMGWRESAKDGFIPECDIRLLNDNTPIILHDAAVDRTMTGATGNVANLSQGQWRSLLCRPVIPGGATPRGTFWIDLLNEFGGRQLICPEVGIAGTQGPIIQPVIDRGLQRSVIFQCFDYPSTQAIAAAGCCALLLTYNTLSASTTATLAQVAASGIEFIGYRYDVTAAEVAQAQAVGLKVIIYTIDTVADYLTAIVTKGADGVFSNDPWLVSGRGAPKNRDPFDLGVGWSHMVGNMLQAGTLTPLAQADLITRFHYQPQGILRRQNLASEANVDTFISCAMGWGGNNRGPTLKLRLSAQFLENANVQTAWFGFFLGTQTSPDGVYTNQPTAGQTGYHFLIRRNGDMGIYKITPSAITSIAGSIGNPTIAAAGARSQPKIIEIDITTSSVYITNITDNTRASVADNSYRGAFRLDLTCYQTEAQWYNMGLSEST